MLILGVQFRREPVTKPPSRTDRWLVKTKLTTKRHSDRLHDVNPWCPVPDGTCHQTKFFIRSREARCSRIRIAGKKDLLQKSLVCLNPRISIERRDNISHFQLVAIQQWIHWRVSSISGLSALFLLHLTRGGYTTTTTVHFVSIKTWTHQGKSKSYKNILYHMDEERNVLQVWRKIIIWPYL